MTDEEIRHAEESTLEGLAVDTILQTPRQVTIGGVAYDIAPPTPATLFLVSRLVSFMPIVNRNAKDILAEVLHKAKDCKQITRIAATLVLGAKRINEKRTVNVRRRVAEQPQEVTGWRKLLPHRRKLKVSEQPHTMLELDWLAGQIAETMTIKQVAALVVELLSSLEIGDFFGIGASLSAANLLRGSQEAPSRQAHGE